MINFKAFFFILLFSTLFYSITINTISASSNSSYTLYLSNPSNVCNPLHIEFLAVVGENSNTSVGQIVSADITPLNGKVNSSLIPLLKDDSIFLDVGSTVYDGYLQTSMKNAYYSAKSLILNSKKCPSLISFEGSLTNLSGPSGGLLMSLAFYSMLSGEEIPLQQYGITGAINSQGKVLPVGGILEKIAAAKKMGKSKIIIPVTNRYDFILSELFFPDMDIYYVTDLNSALNVLRNNSNGSNVSNFLFQLNNNSNLTRTAFNDNFTFKPYYNEIRSLYVNSLNSIDGKIKEADFYKKQLVLADEEFELGYPYTAANDLFLKTAELIALNEVLNKNFEVNVHKSEIYLQANSCLNEALKDSNNLFPNSNNYEYIAGANFRLNRALSTMNSNVEYSTLIYKASIMYSYAEAYEWCRFATQLYNTSKKIQGEPINNQLLGTWVVNTLNTIDENNLDSSTYNFYILSLKSAARQDYLTAAYYLAYLKADLHSSFYNYTNYSSFWGSVFNNHKLYFEQKYNNKNVASVYDLSNNLEYVSSLIKDIGTSNSSNYILPIDNIGNIKNTNRNNTQIIYKDLGLISMLLLVVGMGLVIWMVEKL